VGDVDMVERRRERVVGDVKMVERCGEMWRDVRFHVLL
jgi:hypothetical protein